MNFVSWNNVKSFKICVPSAPVKGARFFKGLLERNHALRLGVVMPSVEVR